MVHLLCSNHGVRTQVVRAPINDMTEEKQVAIHRKDGRRCDSTLVKIGVKMYPVTSSVFHASGINVTS